MLIMKKVMNFSAVLFFLGLATAVMGQFSLGVKGGMQWVDVKAPIVDEVEQISDFQAIRTAHFGLVSEYEIADFFAVQPELSYTTKGFKVDEQFDINLFNVPVPLGARAYTRFNYLEMPLLAKAKIGNDVVEGYVLAGPTFGYALNGNIQTRANFLVEIDVFESRIDLDELGYNRFEVGGMAGLGFAVKTNSGKIFADARYSHGFTESYDVPLLTERVQNEAIAVSVGYMVQF
jgi:hypothetical protein